MSGHACTVWCGAISGSTTSVGLSSTRRIALAPASVRGESLRIIASQADGAPARIVRSVGDERLERDVGDLVAADVDDPHADALVAPAPADRLRCRVSQPLLRRSVTIVSCRVG